MRYRKQRLILSGLLFVVSLLACLVLVFAPERVGEFSEDALARYQEGKKWAAARFGWKRADPSDLWYRAFMKLQDGEAAERKGDLLVAWNRYEEASIHFDLLARGHPGFHPDLVRYRREQLVKSKHDLETRIRPAIQSDWEPFEDSTLHTKNGDAAVPDWNAVGR